MAVSLFGRIAGAVAVAAAGLVVGPEGPEARIFTAASGALAVYLGLSPGRTTRPLSAMFFGLYLIAIAASHQDIFGSSLAHAVLGFMIMAACAQLFAGGLGVLLARSLVAVPKRLRDRFATPFVGPAIAGLAVAATGLSGVIYGLISPLYAALFFVIVGSAWATASGAFSEAYKSIDKPPA
jgi:hypothetical protein